MQVSFEFFGGQSKPPSERVSPEAESRIVPAPRSIDGAMYGVIPFGAGSSLGFLPDAPPEPAEPPVPPELLEQPSSAALASAAAETELARCTNFMDSPLAR